MIISDYTKFRKKLFLKDPETTELGQKIVNESIKMIDEIGFLNFNFKKLASRIDSTEASLYRYFENKHKLLFYLINWYWSWVKYNIDFKTANIRSPRNKIKMVIKVICNSIIDDPATEHIDEAILSRIVMVESTKAFTSKNVAKDYDDGLFDAYHEVVGKIAEIILLLNPNYAKPKALSISIIKTAHDQLFFSLYLPEITDLQATETETSQIEDFLEEIIFSAIKKEK
jgi:AcrR family transcriptional regulator